MQGRLGCCICDVYSRDVDLGVVCCVLSVVVEGALYCCIPGASSQVKLLFGCDPAVIKLWDSLQHRACHRAAAAAAAAAVSTDRMHFLAWRCCCYTRACNDGGPSVVVMDAQCVHGTYNVSPCPVHVQDVVQYCVFPRVVVSAYQLWLKCHEWCLLCHVVATCSCGMFM